MKTCKLRKIYAKNPYRDYVFCKICNAWHSYPIDLDKYYSDIDDNYSNKYKR